MPIIAKKTADFVPCPVGVHQAVCVDVVDLGMLEDSFSKTKKHKIKIVWQVDDRNPETGKRFIVQRRYTNSLHDKATLRKDLQSWRGRPFTADELKGFDLELLLGANCQLNVVHNDVDGTPYANVEAIMPILKGMPKIASEQYIRVQDRPQENGNEGYGDHGIDEGDGPPF